MYFRVRKAAWNGPDAGFKGSEQVTEGFYPDSLGAESGGQREVKEVSGQKSGC